MMAELRSSAAEPGEMADATMSGPNEGQDHHFLGVDIGGSGMKARLVNTATGVLVTERTKRTTPASGDVASVMRAFSSLVAETGWRGPIGITFPGVISNNVALTARNFGPGWVGSDLVELFERAVAVPVAVLNDADAAAVAEARFGAAQDATGLTALITLGTGIGSGLLVGDRLVPNTELGQVLIEGMTAEQYCSSAARVRDDLSFEEFGDRLNAYLNRLSDLIWPDLILVGGGISRDFDQYCQLLDVQAMVRPAQLRNEAGIVGAALTAAARFGVQHPD
jgi:polyphosphate glucokinase